MKKRKLPGPKEVFEKFYRSIGQQQSRALLSRLLEKEALASEMTLSRFLAYAIAVLVHISTVFIMISGVWALIWSQFEFWRVVLVVIPCFWLTWKLRPHLPTLPRYFVERDKFPALYAFVDSVAEILGVPPIDGIVIDEAFDASFLQTGLKRKHILTLGLPLWSILNKQEKIALVAHELAHSVNGDPTRGLIIGNAIYTLARWYTTLRPAYIISFSLRVGIIGLLMVPFNLVMFCLSMIPWGIGYVLIHLMWREQQRAEYLSDYLATTVSGREGMISLLEKLYFHIPFMELVEKLYHRPRRNVKLFEELRRYAAEEWQEKLTQMQNEENEAGGRLDVTHPPNAYRIALLEKKATLSHKMFLVKWSDAIEDAFRASEPRMQHRIFDKYDVHLQVMRWYRKSRIH